MEAFSLQKVVKILDSSPLLKGQVDIADEAKLLSLIHSTFEVLVV